MFLSLSVCKMVGRKEECSIVNADLSLTDSCYLMWT